MGQRKAVGIMIATMAILVGGFVQAWAAESQSAPAAPVWRNLGPGGGGWIECICASEQRDGELLLSCDVGGFYRSTDGGQSYTITNTGLRDYCVECIVPDPLDPNVIYVGGESGVHKSTDRGRKNGGPGRHPLARWPSIL
jgi:hypothetical protein